MNAERLLAHYEQIADAPDAIARLRRFVLDLAVRGKLVPQDPNDEPASELLKRIAKEKARLVKAGEIREGKSLSPIRDDELPFELPLGWAWTRLGNLIHLVSGQHLQPSEYSEDPKTGLPYITGPSDFGADGLQISRFALVRRAVAKQGQLLLTVKGSGVGKTATCNLAEVAISRQLMALTAICWDSRFLVLVTHRLAEKLQEQARSLIPGISREDVDGFRFALPPLAEQHRIVAKVDELMALIDRLEAARAAREATRDRLTAASLTRLNTPDTKASPAKVGTGFASGDASQEESTFRDDARFALDALPALTARADQTKQLRQTILNLAVRGKLVPQDPNDEPVSELLKRIAKEKARLVKAGEIREGKSLSPIRDDELPFELPLGWAWTRLGNLIHLVSGQHLQPSEYSEDPKTGLPYITGPSDFGADGLQISRFALVRRAVAKQGQLLLTVKGSGVGKTATCNLAEVAISRQLMALTAICWDSRFLVLVTHRLAEKLQEQARSLIPGISREDVDGFRFALPPLAEQHRIVAKVDELMALCDRLEANLATADDTRRRLLEALLAEALAPADARELEAAE
jgi:type I restriction enzyme S subunit